MPFHSLAGWTDEAREASIEARKAKAKGEENKQEFRERQKQEDESQSNIPSDPGETIFNRKPEKGLLDNTEKLNTIFKEFTAKGSWYSSSNISQIKADVVRTVADRLTSIDDSDVQKVMFILRDPEPRLGYKDDPIAHLVDTALDTWADTSSDHNLFALEMQYAAAAEFTINKDIPEKLRDRFALEKRLDENYDLALRRTSAELAVVYENDKEKALAKLKGEKQDRINIMRKVLRKTYENTQEELKKLGIKDIIVFRGTAKQGIRVQKDAQFFDSNPISSWTTDKQVAASFAQRSHEEGLDSFIIATKVPASHIFSLAFTGPGCMGEREVVVIGHPKQKARFIKYDPETM